MGRFHPYSLVYKKKYMLLLHPEITRNHRIRTEKKTFLLARGHRRHRGGGR
jgi:hypothetical protein